MHSFRASVLRELFAWGIPLTILEVAHGKAKKFI